MFFVMRGFVMLMHFRSITQFKIRAERLHLIPIARILRRRFFHVRVRCWHGIHSRPRRHKRRKWRETNRVRNRRVVLRLRRMRFGRLRLRSHSFGSQRFRRKMRMRLPLRKRLARQGFQSAARRWRAESLITPRKTFSRRERSSTERFARCRTVLYALVSETRRRYRFVRSFLRFFVYIFRRIPMLFRFVRRRFNLSKTRRVARRRLSIMRVHLGGRSGNIRRASLPELRQRLSRQQRRNVSFRRSRLARVFLGRP